MKITPNNAGLGARIEGIDLATIGDIGASNGAAQTLVSS